MNLIGSYFFLKVIEPGFCPCYFTLFLFDKEYFKITRQFTVSDLPLVAFFYALPREC